MSLVGKHEAMEHLNLSLKYQEGRMWNGIMSCCYIRCKILENLLIIMSDFTPAVRKEML